MPAVLTEHDQYSVALISEINARIQHMLLTEYGTNKVNKAIREKWNLPRNERRK